MIKPVAQPAEILQVSPYHHLLVDIATQVLFYFKEGQYVKHYPVSTALNGVGEKIGSYQTPRGWHVVRAKIGHHQPLNTVFISRRPTGEIYRPELEPLFPERDWILTRILWLSGLERGKNRLGECDTFRRYIYIHGSPDNRITPIPGSKGCIRMRSHDIVELFDSIDVGTTIFIRG